MKKYLYVFLSHFIFNSLFSLLPLLLQILTVISFCLCNQKSTKGSASIRWQAWVFGVIYLFTGRCCGIMQQMQVGMEREEGERKKNAIWVNSDYHKHACGAALSKSNYWNE